MPPVATSRIGRVKPQVGKLLILAERAPVLLQCELSHNVTENWAIAVTEM